MVVDPRAGEKQEAISSDAWLKCLIIAGLELPDKNAEVGGQRKVNESRCV